MNIIITEEQYDRVINQSPILWIKRRYDLVIEELEENFKDLKEIICRNKTYEEFEHRFFSMLMDGLHPYFYDDESFNYDEMFDTLKDMFYVECTEFYFKGRERC